MNSHPPVDKFFMAHKGFIVHNGLVLVLHESSNNPDGTQTGRYGLPGGRLNPGEHFLDALTREICEETGLEVAVTTPLLVDEWRPTVRGEHWQIVGVFYLCTAITTDIVLSHEHDGFLWIEPSEHTKYNLIANEHAVFDAYLSRPQDLKIP